MDFYYLNSIYLIYVMHADIPSGVVQKYSFMASPAGTPYVSSASSLGVSVKMNNFIQFPYFF